MNNEHLTNKTKQLLDRVLKFAVDIIHLVDKLPKTPAGFNIANQLVRSATSMGANCEEAQGAASKKDFINKMHVVLKEAKESKYWLKIIQLAHLLVGYSVERELKEADELCAIFSSIVKKAKTNLLNVK